MEIKDKVIIVTGASEGIGLETAKLLSKKGATVILVARSLEKLKEIKKIIDNSYAIQADLRRPVEIKRMIKKTIDKYGKIDILINNAGQGMYGPVEDIKVSDLKKIMELNLYAVIIAIQEVIPYMKKQGKGIIINVSSGVTKGYIPGIAGYSSSKYALNAITFIARQELAKDNIIVSAMLPKMTATRFGEHSIGRRPDFTLLGRPMPQVDPPEKVAEKIAELIEKEVEQISL